jgi:hypothetical protein
MPLDGVGMPIDDNQGWWLFGIGRGHHAGDIARVFLVLLVGGKSLLCKHSEDRVAILVVIAILSVCVV